MSIHVSMTIVLDVLCMPKRQYVPRDLRRCRRRSLVRHKVSWSNISRTIWPRITQFYTDIHTIIQALRIRHHQLFSVGSYCDKTVENTADDDDFCWNFSRTVQTRNTKFYKLIGDNRPHKIAAYDVTGWAASVWPQNAIKYCAKVRKMGPVGQRVE